MDRQTKTPTAAPAAPAPPALPAQGALDLERVIPGTTVTPGELARMSYQQLRARLSELRGLRSDLASRRDALASSYERATGANRESIGLRLEVLDKQIVTYEGDIAAVGRAAAAKAPADPPFTGTGQPSSNHYNEGDIAGAVFGTFLATLMLSIFIARRFARGRGRMAQQTQPGMVQSGERLDRIEQAVDSIAVEIERVSENQRFMTRLMTETQLGDTLKDVRKSTELAKNAAEGSG